MTEPTSTPYAPVIRTQADLESAWRHLVHPLGFHGCSLRLMMIQTDDRPLPQLLQIDGCDGPPVRAETDRLASILLELPDAAVGPRQRWAVLRCRPGAAEVDDEDRAWAAMLRDSCDQVGVRLEPLHVASDHAIRPVPVDELRRVS